MDSLAVGQFQKAGFDLGEAWTCPFDPAWSTCLEVGLFHTVDAAGAVVVIWLTSLLVVKDSAILHPCLGSAACHEMVRQATSSHSFVRNCCLAGVKAESAETVPV